ncbi:MAG: hypothetical protein IJM79_00485 [Erysipelotrichaceae bacterium]|nr:hypothetical protein [Erysipelotrichaceae bacterium]
MNLTLKTNYDTVLMAGKAVKLNEEYDNRTMVNRFVETVANTGDEAAINYILDTDYQNSDPYIRSAYNELVRQLNAKARIFNTFSIETSLLGRNAGAGFCALVRREDFNKSVAVVENMLHLLGLDEKYRLLTRFENQAVYAIIRK